MNTGVTVQALKTGLVWILTLFWASSKHPRTLRGQMIKDSGSGLRSILDKTGMHNLLEDVEGKEMASPLCLHCSFQWSRSNNCASHWDGWCKVLSTSSDTLEGLSVVLHFYYLYCHCPGFWLLWLPCHWSPRLVRLGHFLLNKKFNNILVYLLLFYCFLNPELSEQY